MRQKLRFVVHVNGIIVIAFALYFFILPAVTLGQNLVQLRAAQMAIPPFTFDWHRSLSPKFEAWARERVRSAAAVDLDVNNISGTEWPMFSTVFYLWATEALQLAWEEEPSLFDEMPMAYSQGAVESSAALIVDPNNANWVKIHWGEDYLKQENLFYRMLLISGLTSYQKLTNNNTYEPLLRSQVESLTLEIDTSPYGMIDDYPGQYYSIDMVAAIAAVQRADAVLDTNHGEFVQRALRAFSGRAIDPLTSLPTYAASSKTGNRRGLARGVGGAYMLIWAPELWPETADHWYESFEDHFWQENAFAVGYRELARQLPAQEWFMDVDAGPVVGGYGTAATAFGLGAARVNGRFDQAYPLTAQALAVSWPLPNGTRLGPKLLSNLSDAPYAGEAALLFTLTRRPISGPISEVVSMPTGGMPLVVYVFLVGYLGIGSVLVWRAVRSIREWQGHVDERYIGVWLVLVGGGVVLIGFGRPVAGFLVLLLAQGVPIRQAI